MAKVKSAYDSINIVLSLLFGLHHTPFHYDEDEYTHIAVQERFPTSRYSGNASIRRITNDFT